MKKPVSALNQLIDLTQLNNVNRDGTNGNLTKPDAI